MKKKKNEDFILVGHLQVLDEALSSLYSDRKSGQYFLFVRVYEDDNDNTFVLTQVQPSVVLDYIDGKVGLKQIFSLSPSYFYKQVVQSCMRREDFVPIDNQEVDRKLQDDGLDDTFNMALANNSVGIRNYLRKVV
jgi:hypothetical protein